MPTGHLKEIISFRPEGVRLLGVDIGDKTLGLAVSDDAQRIATPLKTLKRTKFSRDADALKTVIEDFGIGGYILGYPVNMDGTEGPRCDVVRSFADEMTKYPPVFGTDPWIALWDERLSTVSVEDFVDKHVNKRKAKERGVIDKLAAQVILEGALGFLNRI